MPGSTVYDLAALKLHPDGTRAGTKQGRHSRDPRGNSLAIDAGGDVRVPKRPLVNSSSGEEDTDRAADNRRAASKETKFEFPGSQTTLLPKSDSIFSKPSAELINTIHHMASVHWSERGQLLNLSRDWREQRKRTRHIRVNNEDAQSQDPPQYDNTPVIRPPSPQSDLEASKSDRRSPSPSGTPDRRRKRIKRGASHVDMYMSLDGSAITAIGMLVQEQISHALRSHPIELTFPNPQTGIDDSEPMHH
ncbi:hypothetical protein BS47DRAFT_1390419 [Hydnum rufescens UP504]|uniref:Uncharacterized protein n=1 Tax=Hydnum rufescens UP504 TaxID=1448309 RepID=A0A9P6DWW7_9AGAM|nr:hypothetical protein BS47DRAFT_1390419 [Hydnum rufescens UP504]